jgi:hypothetical protein
MPASMNADETNRDRVTRQRWFQFSLRTAFILIAAGTLLVWWWVPGEQEPRNSRVIVQKWTPDLRNVRITTIEEWREEVHERFYDDEMKTLRGRFPV